MYRCGIWEYTKRVCVGEVCVEGLVLCWGTGFCYIMVEPCTTMHTSPRHTPLIHTPHINPLTQTPHTPLAQGAVHAAVGAKRPAPAAAEPTVVKRARPVGRPRKDGEPEFDVLMVGVL